MTITAQPDQLGIEHHAPGAQPLAEVAKLRELARYVATGTRPEGESAAVDAHPNWIPSRLTSSTQRESEAAGSAQLPSSIGAMNRRRSSRSLIEAILALSPRHPVSFDEWFPGLRSPGSSGQHRQTR